MVLYCTVLYSTVVYCTVLHLQQGEVCGAGVPAGGGEGAQHGGDEGPQVPPSQRAEARPGGQQQEQEPGRHAAVTVYSLQSTVIWQLMLWAMLMVIDTAINPYPVSDNPLHLNNV